MQLSAMIPRSFLRDVSIGGRLMLRSPAYSTLVVLALALGIGPLTAAFSLAYGLLLKPLPYPDADRIVSIQSIHPELGHNLLSRVETYGVFRDESRSFEQLAAVKDGGLQVVTPDGSRRLDALLTTPGLFEMLGVRPALGRIFRQGEGRYGSERVAVLTHRLWQEAYDGDRSVIGSTLRFAGDPVLGGLPTEEGAVTIVGVLPEGFRAPFANYDPDLWIADSLDAERISSATHLMAFGRIRDGISVAAAEQEVGAIFDAFQRASGFHDSEWRTRLQPLREFFVGSLERSLFLLSLAGFVVYVVAVANAANLALTRSHARSSEAALRCVLGARRRRLVGQLAAESVIPTLVAGALGLFIGWLLLVGFERIGAFLLPSRYDVGLDPIVLVQVLAAVLVTNLVFALVPAFHFSGLRPGATIRGASATASRGAGRGRFILVGLQVALALMVAVASVLLIETLLRMQRIETGFQPEGVMTASLRLPQQYYPEGIQRQAFYLALLREVRGIPGVEEAGLVNHLPFSGASAATEVAVEDPVPHLAGENVQVQFRAVSPGYLKTLGVPLKSGRYLEQGDLTNASVIVSEEAARKFWGSRSAVNRRLKVGGRDSRSSWSTVRGVVGDVRHDSLTRDSEPTIYLPLLADAHQNLVVRTEDDSQDWLAAALRERLAAVDPKQPLGRVEPLTKLVARDLRRPRLTAWMTGGLTLVTLLLALVGVYGATWHSVVERRKEIGIRHALGADRKDILGIMMRRVLPWLVAGVVVGGLAAWALSHYLSSLLYEIEVTDPVAYLAVAAFILLIGALGTFLPTRRASRIDPAETIKA